MGKGYGFEGKGLMFRFESKSDAVGKTHLAIHFRSNKTRSIRSLWIDFASMLRRAILPAEMYRVFHPDSWGGWTVQRTVSNLNGAKFRSLPQQQPTRRISTRKMMYQRELRTIQHIQNSRCNWDYTDTVDFRRKSPSSTPLPRRD